MKSFRFRCIATFIGAALAASAANAATIATFADPAPDGSTPLFAYDGNALTGGWSLGGLTLLTPGLPLVPDIANATFAMSPLTVNSINGSVVLLSGGQIEFFDGVDLVFQITFDGASLTTPFGFGASEFAGYNVQFSGPNVPGDLTAEAFAFAFANPQGTPDDFTVTASFTSSAIPEPASLAALALLACVGLRRR
jgi:hypothetical protein